MRKRESFSLSLYTTSALIALGQGVIIPTLPLFASSFEVSLFLVSMAVAAASLSQLLLDIPLGFAIDRVGRTKLIILGPAILAISSIAIFYSTNIWELIICRLIFGLGFSMWSIANHVSIGSTSSPNHLGTAMSVLGGTQRLGILVGPVLGGFVAALYGFHSPFGIFALLSALAVPILFAGRMPFLKRNPPVIDDVRPSVFSAIRMDRKRIWISSSAFFLTTAARRGRLILIPLFGAIVIHLPIEQIGFVMTISAITDLAMFVPAGYLMDRWGRKFAIVPAFAIMGFGIAMIPFSNDFLSLMISSLIIGIGNGLGSGTMMTLGFDLAPENVRGGFIGIWRAVGDLGAFFGPLAVGLLADQFNFLSSALVIALLCFASSTIVGLFLKETLQKPH